MEFFQNVQQYVGDFLLNYGWKGVLGILAFLWVSALVFYNYIMNRKLKKQRESTGRSTVSLTPSFSNKLENGGDIDPLKNLVKFLAQSGWDWSVKKELGISIPGGCLATTAKEAEEMYLSTPDGSDEEYHTLLRWTELVEDRKSIKSLREEIDGIPHLVEMLEKRTRPLFTKWIQESSDKKYLKELFEETEPESEASKLAVKKLYEMFQKTNE